VCVGITIYRMRTNMLLEMNNMTTMIEMNRKIVNALWMADIKGKIVDSEIIEVVDGGSTFNITIRQQDDKTTRR